MGLGQTMEVLKSPEGGFLVHPHGMNINHVNIKAINLLLEKSKYESELRSKKTAGPIQQTPHQCFKLQWLFSPHCGLFYRGTGVFQVRLHKAHYGECLYVGVTEVCNHVNSQ